jgi:hypothetical protein
MRGNEWQKQLLMTRAIREKGIRETIVAHSGRGMDTG